jgi:16S rRNA (adenine1518-N6/adenine1519-N6)-dimethyltransferase
MSIDRQTRSYLMQLFQEHGINPRHDLGQNFLIDLNVLDLIVRRAKLTRDDVVLEVGPGTGSMTAMLASEAAHVVSVEYDANMHMLASKTLKTFNNVTLINSDALRNKSHLHPLLLEAVQEALAVNPERRLKLVANLPYNIGTPVISNLMALDLPWTLMVVTIQYELALRMQAAPSTNDYGALSVWLQAQSDVEIVRKIAPTCFWPRPNVDSAVVSIAPNDEKRARITDRAFLQEIIRHLFNHRRKALRGVLAGFSDLIGKPETDAILAELDIAGNVRAEQLDPPTLVKLANRFRAAVPNFTGAAK